MYFPYFRGRQYELLALRELAEKNLLGNRVIPVVEPIKLSSTFSNTMSVYATFGMRIGIVFNPSVGDLAADEDAKEELYSFLDGKRVLPSILIDSSALECLNNLETTGVSRTDTLAILNNRDFLDIYKDEYGTTSPSFTFFPDDRKIKHAVNRNKVIFEDKFVKQSRNADYPDDEFFSEDHQYYAVEGYTGFGDYSIVGSEYTESAFAPYAVAIHIVYFAKDMTLRVRHFISDSNSDTSDVAGKFYEAVSKMAGWFADIPSFQLTRGLETLLRHYENRTYPGLPTLKKLSIMHHLELVGKFLQREK